jgi:hypothetical protein
MVPRFLLFDDKVRQTEEKQGNGGELSIEDGEMLKARDLLRDRLAFLRPAGGPVAMPRQNPQEPVIAKPAKPAQNPNDGTVTSQDISGKVLIKNDYSLRDVLGTVAAAAKSPVASFVSSTKDLVKKATEGKALTAEEQQSIYRYAGIVDSFMSLTPAGAVMQMTGTTIDMLNSAIDGEMPPPGQLVDDLRQPHGMVNPMSTAERTKTKVSGGSITKPGDAQAPAPPITVQAPVQRPVQVPPPPKRPVHRDLFDFPKLRVPPSYWSQASRSVESAKPPASPKPPVSAKPFFKPPTRLENGQTGYVLSPTRPPHLPPEKGSEPEPGANGSTTAPNSADLDGPSGACCPGRRYSTGENPLPGVPVWAAGSDLKRLAGKGPVSLMPATDALMDKKSVEQVRAPFFYYRNDRDVKDMGLPRAVRQTDHDMRRDVLTVGNGDDVTSYVADSKVHMGRYWGHGPAMLSDNMDVIQLGNGRDGVGAIKLPFANLRPGSSVVVTGGAMNGCTMLFAADKNALYAYHAGTASLNASWHTSSDGARSIADAHDLMGPPDKVPHPWQNNNTDLIAVGRQYPFSALVYSGQYLARTRAVAGASAVAAVVANTKDPVPNAELDVPRHAYGPREGRRWQMMTFNYMDPDDKQRSIGVAEAVVSKDEKGAISISVLAERGRLDRRTSLGDRGDAIAYRYKTADSDSSTWFVPIPVP